MITLSFSFFYTIVCIFTVLVLLNILLLLREKRRNFKKLKDEFGYPTPPLTNPFFGHMDELGERDKEFKWHNELGKVFGVYNCDLPQLKISDPNLINEVFLKQNKLFNSRVWHEHRLEGIKESILLNKGEDWRKIRRIIRPALAEYRVKPNDTHINDIKCGLDKLINVFKYLTSSDRLNDEHDPSRYAKEGFMTTECVDSPTGLALDFNAYDVMQVVTLDVIFRLAFNLDNVDVTKGAKDENLILIRSILGCVDSLVLKISAAIPISRIVTVPFSKYILLKYYRKFISILVKFHASNKESRERKKMAKNDNNNDGQPRRIHHILWDEYRAGNLTKRQVRANSMAVLIAGFETTATTSSYVLWCIAKHLSCREKLRSDILNYGIESRYLDMFIKEVMRMYPALPNFVIRTPHMDTKLGGYIIKKGMSVYMSVNSVHYDESIWTNPYQFDPERFAEGKTYPPGAYAPFGLGHRMCAGYQLALREMKTIVCELLTNFDIQLIAPSDMITECSSIFLTRPKNEIRLRLIPNNNTTTATKTTTMTMATDIVVESSENVLMESGAYIVRGEKPLLNDDEQSKRGDQKHFRRSATLPALGSDQQQQPVATQQQEGAVGHQHHKAFVSKKLLVETKLWETMKMSSGSSSITKKATISANVPRNESLVEEEEEEKEEEDIFDADQDDIGKRLSERDNVTANRTTTTATAKL